MSMLKKKLHSRTLKRRSNSALKLSKKLLDSMRKRRSVFESMLKRKNSVAFKPSKEQLLSTLELNTCALKQRKDSLHLMPKRRSVKRLHIRRLKRKIASNSNC